MAAEGKTLGSTVAVISLFCGAGCLDLAVERAAASGGVVGDSAPHVVVATDYDAKALSTFSLNFPRVPTLLGDIRQISTRDILNASGLSRGDATLLIGGPPCTPFSKSGFWLEEKRTSQDPNASLLDEYARVVREARPEAFILENVQGLTYATHRRQFVRLLEQLESAGYTLSWRVLMAADYGVPQLRRRVFVIGRLGDNTLMFPEPTHSGWSERDRKVDPSKIPYATAAQAIGDLIAGRSEANELAEGTYADLLAEIPPGQNYLWHTSRYGGRPVFKWRSRYWTFLLRLDPSRPSSTIQAQPGPWVGPFHWENRLNEHGEWRARRLRVPEILRLMTLPDDFIVPSDRSLVQRQIGNAVPLRLGLAVMRSVLAQLGYLDHEHPQSEARMCLSEAVA